MTDERDPILQELFDGVERELDAEDFTSQVMATSRVARYRAVAGWLSAAVVLLTCAVLFVIPVQELVTLLAQCLTSGLVDLGDSWWAMVFSPINSVASVLVLTVKLARMAMSRIRSASYA